MIRVISQQYFMENKKTTTTDTANSKQTVGKQPLSPAHTQADNDIEKDPEFNNKPAPEDGLDEGELAKLEGQDDGEMDVYTEPE